MEIKYYKVFNESFAIYVLKRRLIEALMLGTFETKILCALYRNSVYYKTIKIV